MKVLSLTEPYATLIARGVKKIETRSWKTNYRGKLFIHASSTKMSKKSKDDKELMALVSDEILNYGKIVCSCDLVDCVEMTEEFINKVKENHNEYISGEYSVGRYAWILDNVRILSDKKEVKGHLGIWNCDIELE